MHAAYDGLPEELKTRLDGMTVLHDFNKFWDMMLKRPGTWRKPLTAEQRAKKPPVSHPIFLTHPITGATRALRQPRLCDPHQRTARARERRDSGVPVRPPAPGEVPARPPLERRRRAAWDDIGTLHNAHPDYGPDEHRLIKCCQVMADRIFDPEFVRAALG